CARRNSYDGYSYWYFDVW
nr:immunoglobulin heavy chain junction region [Mus musculus]MBK4198152.1 immunoglobulin heavy chain junction region [Mus musculus]MBK4198153.1 immunoglobulin heavy chain junction region [Mus musculus]MBK4198154.1 immunoglobulin heavy chain junction region [Mus musculus]MBK4198155.1 immunoglobulin heavy chain junction region [Mus musculus]